MFSRPLIPLEDQVEWRIQVQLRGSQVQKRQVRQLSQVQRNNQGQWTSLVQ